MSCWMPGPIKSCLCCREGLVPPLWDRGEEQLTLASAAVCCHFSWCCSPLLKMRMLLVYSASQTLVSSPISGYRGSHRAGFTDNVVLAVVEWATEWIKRGSVDSIESWWIRSRKLYFVIVSQWLRSTAQINFPTHLHLTLQARLKPLNLKSMKSVPQQIMF